MATINNVFLEHGEAFFFCLMTAGMEDSHDF